MYDFHYNAIKNNFDAELLFTDTDSFTYEIKSKDVYEEFLQWKYLFDFSNYSKDAKFFNETNKKVIGKMKDEFGGVIITEIVGLKSNVKVKVKMYSIKKIDGKEHNTAKGNQEHMKLMKYLYHVVTTKDMCYMMEFILYFYKSSVKSFNN